MAQISIFDMLLEPVKIDKPIRLIEIFAGYGSQAMALERMGVDFETYKVVEFDEHAIRSYNAVHGTDFPTIDVRDVTGKSLEIRERERDTRTFLYIHSLVLISASPDFKKGWQKLAERDRLCCGKLREYWKN